MKVTVILLLVVFVGLLVWILYGMLKWKRKFQTISQLVESSKDVVYYYEVPKMKFTYISPSIETFLGKGVIEEAELNLYAPFERVHPDDYETLMRKVSGNMDYSEIFIQRWRDNSGHYRWFEEYASPIYENGQLVVIQGIMRNIDEKVKLQQALEYRIYHDPLTDIYNREYFEKKFEELNTYINVPVALIVCDVDGLKYVNDHFGHRAGDELIKGVAALINQYSTEEISVSRIGGDEFVIITIYQTESQVQQLISDIRKDIEKYNAHSFEYTIKMSIGYSYAFSSIEQMEGLFSQADKKMYEDKVSRKNRVFT
ncbi:diguanylate cyclase (GGDEF)-like protein/PAS domain S-box-containing protein [Bacillus sp. SORGH_AS 510]|uniref:sensor domain-containing diguanylate cyclase n=1 Tax=Bacillus sp. SORGH_AS_0510 TaxID=3041771 RepID=UPI00278317F8|nr:sensor domain-containing diguanylate cyclase [Bacillus sp. SORGH_AS_0510]MDQ1143788.1 diguanylate cyclase (GGDEF)-like protein/PAS domain S-box-containing protein [Bacillus sp. SORGH_AS_0510]